MNNGQAFAALLRIKRSNPEHGELVESVMDYITDLAVAADLAGDNLALAARQLQNDRIIPHNARIVANQLDELISRGPSHGNDI